MTNRFSAQQQIFQQALEERIADHARIQALIEAKHLHFNSSNFPSGYLYIISNPSFPGWHKIGTSFDLDKRLATYQTGDPYRGYVVEYKSIIDDRFKVERELKHFIRNSTIEHSNEWVKLPLDVCRKLVAKTIKKRLDLLRQNLT
jgi:hypothetical protein